MKSYRTKRIKIVSTVTICLFVMVASFAIYNTIKSSLTRDNEPLPAPEVLGEAVLAGDILDSNGNTIVTSSKDENGKQILQFRDNYAYSTFVGTTEGPDGDETDIDDTYGLYEIYADELYRMQPDATKGASVQLTIDCELQEYAYDLLEAKEKRGSIVIMEAKTGEIKACVFTPSFDAANLENGWIEELRDKGGYIRPLGNPVVPGSIYKIVTSIGVLEQGLENVVVEDKGYIKFSDDYELVNYKRIPYGNISLSSGFEHSSNVYFGTMGKDYLQISGLNSLAERCQLGKTLQLDFANVTSRFEVDDSAVSQAWTAIGQGKVELTAVNAAMIVQMVANDGEMLKPYAVEKVFQESNNGDVNFYTGRTQSYKRVTTPEVTQKLRQIMKSTGENYLNNLLGTSTIEINGENISVGMKTGTGETGEEKDGNSIWIASMAPAENPEYVIVMNVYGTDQMGRSLLNDVISLYQKTMEGND